MTILFLSRLFYPHVGGVEKHVLEISKRLVNDGHIVHIITENNSWSTLETINGITIHRMNVSPDDRLKKFRIWIWMESNKKLIEQADIIHCHDVFFWYFPFRFFFVHKPVYTTFHGYETIYPPAKKAIIIRKISERISFGNICIGDYITKWYGTKPTIISYGGINEELLKLKDQKPEGGKLNIIFIGRLEKDTGLTRYLKALDILKEKNIQYTFEAFGDGSLRKIVESYGKVHGFTQSLTKPMQQASLIFASSYLTILEALAMKKQVFSLYDNPLKRDYLCLAPFASWIIIEESPKILVEKMIEQNKKHNQKKIDEAYSWVKTQTWNHLVKQYYSLWKI